MIKGKHPQTASATAQRTTTMKAPYKAPKLTEFGSVAALTRGTGATANGDAGQQMMVQSNSERSMKENIVRVGEHPYLGIGLYLFDYKPAYQDVCGHGRQFGVMVDEVEPVMPSAVSIGPFGAKAVNYSMLGILRHSA